jgi:hypothetical protein
MKTSPVLIPSDAPKKPDAYVRPEVTVVGDLVALTNGQSFKDTADMRKWYN